MNNKKYLVYYVEFSSIRGNSCNYGTLHITQKIQSNDFVITTCEPDYEEIARIVKVFDNKEDAEEYAQRMINIYKGDQDKYLKILLQDRQKLKPDEYNI